MSPGVAVKRRAARGNEEQSRVVSPRWKPIGPAIGQETTQGRPKTDGPGVTPRSPAPLNPNRYGFQLSISAPSASRTEL